MPNVVEGCDASGMRSRGLRARVLVVGVVALVLSACGSTSTSPSTTTSGATTSTSEATAVQPATAIWPFVRSSDRYSDPVAAARSFAISYLGFVDPVVGPFQQGDQRSGEVTVRSSLSGPITTVLVRQVTSDHSWWIIGASTPNLQIQSPSALAAVTSPVVVSGQSTAFEATINLEVRQDGSTTPLVKGIGMGGSMGVMGPFSTSLSFPAPSERAGAIVVETFSAENGNVQEASVVRISFGP